jgi:hypothetical protein
MGAFVWRKVCVSILLGLRVPYEPRDGGRNPEALSKRLNRPVLERHQRPQGGDQAKAGLGSATRGGRLAHPRGGYVM